MWTEKVRYKIARMKNRNSREDSRGGLLPRLFCVMIISRWLFYNYSKPGIQDNWIV